MIRKKRNYNEGDWFAVPLRNGGYAVGLIARMDGEGGILGYFFGPKHSNLPSAQETYSLSTKDAVLVRRFGDPGILRGEWPIIWHSNSWNREEWPQPAFGRITMDQTKATFIEYNKDNISKAIREVPISVEDARKLPDDGMSSNGAIEIRLTKLLES